MPAVGAVPQAIAANVDYFPPGPARVLTLSLLPGANNDDLQGVVCQGERTCTDVPYPYLLRSIGVADLDKALHMPPPDPSLPPPRQFVYGYSQGARVAANWLEEHAATEGAPAPEELGFVLIGNPGRKHGGAHVGWGQQTPDTEYQVLDVSRQYDMASDYPDDPQNLLALLNAFAGFVFIHASYEDVDIYDSANYVWKEGNTTYVLVPTENLPLLEPLRRFGLSGIADALNGPLKEAVERAYDRSYLPDEPGWPAADPEPEEPPAEEPDETSSALAKRTSLDTVDVESVRVTEDDEFDEDVDADSGGSESGSDSEDVDFDLESEDDAVQDDDAAAHDAAVQDDEAQEDAAQDDEAEDDDADTEQNASDTSDDADQESSADQ